MRDKLFARFDGGRLALLLVGQTDDMALFIIQNRRVLKAGNVAVRELTLGPNVQHGSRAFAETVEGFARFDGNHGFLYRKQPGDDKIFVY